MRVCVYIFMYMYTFVWICSVLPIFCFYYSCFYKHSWWNNGVIAFRTLSNRTLNLASSLRIAVKLCLCVCVTKCVCICVCACVCVCVCVCVCGCVYVYTHVYKQIQIHMYMYVYGEATHTCMYMGWLWSVRSIKLHVSFAKEPYTRDDILSPSSCASIVCVCSLSYEIITH